MTQSRTLVYASLALVVLGLSAWFALRTPESAGGAPVVASAPASESGAAAGSRLDNLAQPDPARVASSPAAPAAAGTAPAAGTTADPARPPVDRSQVPGTREWRARILRSDLAAFEGAAARLDGEQWENLLMPVLTSAVAVELDRAGRHLPLSERSRPLPSQHEFQFNNGKYRPGLGEFPAYDEFLAARTAALAAQRAFNDSNAPGNYKGQYPFDPSYLQRVRDLVAQAEAHLQESDAPWPESQYAR